MPRLIEAAAAAKVVGRAWRLRGTETDIADL